MEISGIYASKWKKMGNNGSDLKIYKKTEVKSYKTSV